MKSDVDSFGAVLVGGMQVATNFTKLKLAQTGFEDPNAHCLAGKFIAGSIIELTPVPCDATQAVICRQILIGDVDCSTPTTFVKKNTFDLLLDPKLQIEKKIGIERKKKTFKAIMENLDQTKSFKAIFSNLWYASTPCFDVKGVTSQESGEKSILKACKWKEKPISCSAIFTTFPTDRGMCCTFNMKAAADIFQGSEFPGLVKSLQESDKNNSFADSTLPKYYLTNNEPKTLPGRGKGLVLILDAHTDLLAAGSIDSDFEGFLGYIGGNSSFPLLSQGGFEILPGHNNIIALSGSKIDAEEDLRSLKVEDRNCKFPDERDGLTLYKTYSYTNCIFECSLLYAKDSLKTENNSTYDCIPWYFPSSSDAITLCDPWETIQFLDYMITNIPDDQCPQCKPDCQTTLYERSVTSVPFRRCDSNNLGVSFFCNLNSKDGPKPNKFAQQVFNEYAIRGLNETFLQSLQSGMRTYAKTLTDGDVFTLNPKTYDAYDKDIAMVEIFFQKSTIFQMGIQPRMTWIDYLSTVGGLVGLVLGMGIVSFIELIWLCMRIAAKKYNFSHIIP